MTLKFLLKILNHQRFLIVSLLAFSCWTFVLAEKGWHDRKAEGWAWYEDTKKESNDSAKSKNHEKESASQKLAKVRQEIEEKMAKAILDPTHENVRDYALEQKRWVDQSAIFARAWSHLLLENPEIDNTVQNPVSQYGTQVQKQVKQDKVEALIKSLTQKHGLFFFFKGTCQYCHAFARVVEAISKKYEWNVLAITLDSHGIAQFPDFREDNGISEKFNIKNVPALFVVNPKTQEVTPVAYGPLSLEQVESNIFMQFSEAFDESN